MDIVIKKDEPIISVRGLMNAFGDQVVHDNLDLDVYPGEIIGIVGGSGTGKSVLLKSIIGLNNPQAGNISMYGLNPDELDSDTAGQLDCRWGRSLSGWCTLYFSDGRRKYSGASARARHFAAAPDG